jgi:two-component system heavy metal sensor histidine kinase CusS
MSPALVAGPPSIAWRLGAAFATIAVLSFAAAAVYLYAAIVRQYQDRDEEELRGKSLLIQHVIEEAGTLEKLRGDAQHRLRDIVVGHPGLRLALYDASGRILLTLPERDLPPLDAAGNAAGTGVVYLLLVRSVRGEHRYRVLRDRAHTLDDEVRYVVMLDVTSEATLVGRHLQAIAAAAISGALLCILLGVLVVRRNLRPLQRITDSARAVSATNLAIELPTTELPQELRSVATALNKMLATLRESFGRLSAFSADLAHELRTPIGNMLGLGEVALSKARTADEYRLVLESNMEECERLSRMVSDMLFLAGIERPGERLRRSEFDLADEARHVAQYFEPVLDDRRMAIVVQGSGRINADRDMIRRAITNLVSNAVEHSADGARVQIEVEAGAATVRLRVRNPGPGIAAEYLPHVFDRFYRADPARARGGSGLGLAIVKSIVEVHGGRVVAASDPGRETEFMFELPAANGQEPLRAST